MFLLPLDPSDVQWSKQFVVLYSIHNGIRPAEGKFGLVRKNIYQWLSNFSENGFEQVGIAKCGPEKQQIREGQAELPDCPSHLIYVRTHIRFHCD